MIRYQQCSACGRKCRSTINMCPTCYPVLTCQWLPIYWGNSRFKVARLKQDRLRTQEESAETFATLDEARQECKRRNRQRS